MFDYYKYYKMCLRNARYLENTANNPEWLSSVVSLINTSRLTGPSVPEHDRIGRSLFKHSIKYWPVFVHD